MSDIIERARDIKLVIFDVDGVLTDGSLLFGDDGQQYKAFSARDGHGMRMLQQFGIGIAIITGRESRAVARRMAELGVEQVWQGYRDKLPAFEQVLEGAGLAARQTAYVGDDVVDVPILRRAGLAVAVSDAHAWVKQYAHWITSRPGGGGAVREVCELILQAHGRLDEALRHYLS